MKKIASIMIAVAFIGFNLCAQRSTSTRQAVKHLMELKKPKLSYDSSFSPEEFEAWQNKVTETMGKLMKHPEKEIAEPIKIKTVKRDGYTVEKWLSFPTEGNIVPFLVLVPDGVDESHPAPAVLCIPGWGQSKEMLAGEKIGNFELENDADTAVSTRNMARHMVENGFIALAIDNPSCGELSDNGNFDYLVTSRFLLENGWSYLGLSSWQDRVALNHLRNRDDVNKDRLIVSGFSLGTEPLMVLGALEPDIFAFVYNDILVRTRERILTVEKPDEKGVRPFPNTDEHLVPEFLNYFDFPDLVANLAPRPVICTEGGMERDFDLITSAYEKCGDPSAFTALKYYSDYPEYQRHDTIPGGINLGEFYSYLGVSPGHYFKVEKVIPWLKCVIATEK